MKHDDEPSGTWRTIKIILAVGLLAGAGIFAMGRFGALRPDPDVELPASSQWMRTYAQNIDQNFRDGVAALDLTKEQRSAMDAWMQATRKHKSQQERREDYKQLTEILTPDQLDQFKTLLKDRREKRQFLDEQRKERTNRMLSEKEQEIHKENMKKVREQRQQRIKEQKEAEAAKQESEQ